jgi:hypothetical protein
VAVWRVDTLGDDPFLSSLTHLHIELLASTDDMVGEMDRRLGTAKERFEPSLALDIGVNGQILSVDLDYVESEEGELVSWPLRSMPALEHRLQGRKIGIAIAIQRDDLAVD